MGGASRQVEILGVRACLLQYLCKMRICWKWSKVINNVGRTEKMKLIEEWIIEQFSNTTNGLVTSPVLTLLPTVTQCISDQSWHVFLILASHHFLILSAICQKREITYVDTHPLSMMWFCSFGAIMVQCPFEPVLFFSSSVILLEHSCHYFSAVMKESGEIGAQDQKLYFISF